MKKWSNTRDKTHERRLKNYPVLEWAQGFISMFLDMVFPDYNNQKSCYTYLAISILQSEN